MAIVTDRALITGYPGWLTDHLFRRLDQLSGQADPPAWAAALNGVRWRALVAPGTVPAVVHGRIDDVLLGDIRDPDIVGKAMDGADLVLHAAGIIHPRRIGELYEINRDGCRCLAQAAVASGAQRFVFISSNAAAGFAAAGRPMRESDEPRPQSHYGRSKLEGEQVLWDVLSGTSTEGVVLRPTTFFGPYFPPRHLKAYKLARSGRPLVIGSGNNQVSMIYIDDLVDALGRALTVPQAAGGTAFVAGSESYAWQEVFIAMGQAQGVQVHPLRVPGVVAGLCALGDRVLSSAGLYSMMVHVAGEATQHMACNPEGARTLLGFSPTVDLYDGMKRAVEWAREEGLL